ncbi:MAG TPA: hypothetical protein DEH22_01700 [Chloroflexi bacterium]|nr:hypothetical protein [Chloroflexota bacterium]
MKRLLISLFLLAIFASACGPAEPIPLPTPAAGMLYVDPSVQRGQISPYVYGSNTGPAYVVPYEMMPYVLDAGFTVFRFPGGAWGDRNKLQTYQIDQFMDFLTQTGGIPTISVNLRDGTPEQAAELVRYANIQKGYNIQYWSIGNEPTLYEAELNETYDTEIFNREWRAFGEAMRAVDPNIKLMGPELHQWGGSLEETLKDSSGRDWMTEFLKANGDLVDVVTVHRYPLWRNGFEQVTIPEMRANAPQWNGEIIYLRNLIQEITGREIPMAFTEVNSNPAAAIGGEATPDSFYNAIWFADVLGRLISEQVFMVNHWVLSQRSTGHSLIKGNEIRPSLYVFYLYKHFGDQLVYSASGVQNVSVYAATREDGTLTILLINLTDERQQLPLELQGDAPAEADLWLFDATHNAENLGAQPWPADGVLNLPAQSASLYVIEK